jgi:hypothetical protein
MENAMSQHVTTSRRAVLAGGIALAPAFTATALAKAGCSFPELAAQLSSIYARWKRKYLADEADQAFIDKKIAERTGKPVGWRPDYKDQDFEKWMAVIEDITDEFPDETRVDEHGCDIEWNEIHDVLFDACRDVLAHPAKSVTDLGVQAQAFALANSECFFAYPHDNHSKEARALIVSICRFAGVEPLPGIELAEDDDEAEET